MSGQLNVGSSKLVMPDQSMLGKENPKPEPRLSSIVVRIAS